MTRLLSVLDAIRRWLPKRGTSWPDLVRQEFQWAEDLGLVPIEVNSFLTGHSVRYEGDAFGMLLSEEIEARLGINGYVYRRGDDDDDARNIVWILSHYRPDAPGPDLDPRDRNALAKSTHELSVALADVLPEIIRRERSGGSAW